MNQVNLDQGPSLTGNYIMYSTKVHSSACTAVFASPTSICDVLLESTTKEYIRVYSLLQTTFFLSQSQILLHLLSTSMRYDKIVLKSNTKLMYHKIIRKIISVSINCLIIKMYEEISIYMIFMLL